MRQIPYHRQLEQILEEIDNRPQGRPLPKLLLHSCCAPCSSYVLEYLSNYFQIIDFFYNPNIFPEDEYKKRTRELARMIGDMGLSDRVELVEGRYDPKEFFDAVKGHEKDPEGGERCFICYELRMREAASQAAKRGCDYFTTTLSISPLKNAQKINEIGMQLADEYGAAHLPSDFKKKNGYRRSVELSRIYDLYRQDYCGCIYSKAERELQRIEKQTTGKSDPERK